MRFILQTLLVILAVSTAQAETIRVLNWDDYIDESILNDFTYTTGIEIDYHTFEDEEDFIEQFYESEKPWDIVVPSDNLLSFLIERNALRTIDKKQIRNYPILNRSIMTQLASKDSGNLYAIPYMWGTTGIGINWTAAQAVGIEKTAVTNWSVMFSDDVRSPFAKCGIAAVNERDEIFAAALRYKGFSLNSGDVNEIEMASTAIQSLAEDASYFHSSRYYEDLIEGNVCLVLGYSGDIMFAYYEADDQDIEYVLPAEGSSIWFDVMAIPKNAANSKGAHKFMQFLIQPEVAAINTNYNAYPNPVDSSKALIDEEILNNPAVYPSEQSLAMLESFSIADKRTRRLKKKKWVYANCGAGAFCEVPISIYGY